VVVWLGGGESVSVSGRGTSLLMQQLDGVHGDVCRYVSMEVGRYAGIHVCMYVCMYAGCMDVV
jgi:hypothetical protein